MKRILLVGLSLLLIVLVAVPLALAIGSWLALDRDFSHTRATAGLEVFQAADSAAHTAKLSLIEAGPLTFRARTAGFGGGRGNVILLHGFPESSAMYEPMIPALAKAGYQVVAFDQRGYSPGARPGGVEAYATDKLADDVFAIADAVGFEGFHLVGHDWGAGVGWRIVFDGSPRLRSWSALSIPHLGAYADAISNDPDQQARSAYIGLFRLPWLPEALMSFNGFAMMTRAMYGDHDRQTVDEYLAIFSEPGALTAALNWYRASGLDAGEGNLDVAIPTAFIWGNQDPVVGGHALEAQRRFFQGNLRETELDTGHWLMETEAAAVTAAVLAHIEGITVEGG